MQLNMYRRFVALLLQTAGFKTSMDDLIVFRKTYEYMFWLRPTVERFARVHRYSLGVELQTSALRLLRLIIRANYATDKSSMISEAVTEYEVQRLLLRLAFDYKVVSSRQFTYASERLEEIARLLRGWAKKTIG